MPWELIAQLGSTTFVACFAIWIILKLVQNHLNHNTKSIDRNTEATISLVNEVRGLRNDIKDVLRDLISKK